MILKQFVIGFLKNNCYVLADRETREAVIIDAPKRPAEMIDYLQSEGLTPKYVLITHHHFDHIDGLLAIKEAFPDIKEAQNSIKLGGIDVEVMSTPGHTEDSVCYYLPSESILFSGDTLFYQNIGRVDYGGNLEQELASIRDKLFTLPPQTKVYPGHGRPTTIEHEKGHNPYFKKNKSIYRDI